jgi:hypothetical protein
MLWKIHGINFYHIKLLNSTNIKCQNGLVLPPAQVFYFNGQALHKLITSCTYMSFFFGTIPTTLTHTPCLLCSQDQQWSRINYMSFILDCQLFMVAKCQA